MTDRTNRFVIYEPTMLVALDLEQCLRDHDPQAEIVVAPTLALALATMAEGSVTFAILHAAADQLAATEVPVLLIGDSAEVNPGGRPVLLRPFSASDVASVLRRLGVRGGERHDMMPV
jgi:hypothetical protein